MKSFTSVMGTSRGLFMASTFMALAITGCNGPSSNQKDQSTQPGNTQGSQSSPGGTEASLNPLVHSTSVTLLDTNHPSVAPGVDSTSSVQVVLTVDRDALLKQEFLYGADLQYSSSFDKDMNLYNQSMALGHIPAHFRIAGNELQLIADNKRSFPSDVNHPELLISRYKILSQSEGSPATLTISSANSSGMLTDSFVGVIGDPTVGQPPKKLRDLWVRSFDFIPKGNYLLQQTSIVMEDGTIGEYMESVFPRSNLAPGKDFAKFVMDPGNPAGAKEGPVSRFRMLPGESVYEGEKQVAYAQHFDITQNSDGTGGTIDFYVTRNIPDEALQPVKLAVEGWNRYFTQYKGIQRPVMQFKGRLPEGVYLGDPRFNVINWDSRTVAGAAYETQATDPYTGKQSHSMIYMPAAWLTIGATYWTDGQFSELPEFSVSPAALSGRAGPFHNSRTACLRDVHEGTRLMASGRLNASQLADFPVELLKQTLFHEVGHALGLAHNFKGSLSFDRADPTSLFSTSIMDYNDFEIERPAFKAVDTSEGPQLEYDRQAVAAIYNQGKDIASTDAVLPACNDTEADSEVGGVDPLCIRYDVEKDPTLSIQTAYHRITDATILNDVTLQEALNRVGQSFLKGETLQAIKTSEDVAAFAESASKAIQGVLKFYFVSGKISLSKTVTNNVKSLLQFEDGVLPSAYNEREMRERAFSGVNQAASMLAVPDETQAQLDTIAQALLNAVKKISYFQTLNSEESTKLTEATQSTLSEMGSKFEEDEATGLPALITAVFTALKKHAQAAFYLGKVGSAQVDFETGNMSFLAEAAMDSDRSEKERVAAATSLMSYKGRLSWGDKMIKLAVKKITQQRDAAVENAAREKAEAVLAVLNVVKS